MKKRILLTGGSGLLGQELQRQREGIIAPSRDEVDIAYGDSIYHWISSSDREYHNILIHAAAMTGPVECEKNKRECYSTNVLGTQRLSNHCKQYGIDMIYISTDYVFDGEKGNYKESDHINPVNYYALSKEAGERKVTDTCERVIRTSFCPEKWPHPKAFTDKYSSMESVKVIASKILKLCDRIDDWCGIVHVGGPRRSFHEIAKDLGNDVGKCSIEDVNVKIPVDTSLNTSKYDSIGG